jgi:hypothetical protein
LQEKGWPIGDAAVVKTVEGKLLARRQLLHCMAASLLLAQQQLAHPAPAAAGESVIPTAI